MRSIKTGFCAVLHTALFTVACIAAHAQTPVFSLTPDPNNTTNVGLGFSLGYVFSTTSDVTVTSLGYFTNGGSLTETHDVGIFDSTGTLLGSTTISNASTSIANFKYESVAPIALKANTEYQLMAQSGYNDVYTYDPTSLTTDPRVTLGGDRFWFDPNDQTGTASNVLHFGDSTAGVVGYFGANLILASSPVPEPNAGIMLTAMLVAGSATFMARRRRAK